MRSIQGAVAAIAAAFALLASWSAGAVPMRPAEPTLAQCSWDRPGHNPYMGDVVGAIDRYRDISPEARERLKARMAKRDYDDIVSITRDGINGKQAYGSTIRDMYFGDNQVCRNVTRSAWSPSMHERGLVYCDGRDCILVPTVCRNVSRISRPQVMAESLSDPDGEDEPAAPIVARAPPAVPDGSDRGDGRAMPLGVAQPGSFVAFGAPPFVPPGGLFPGATETAGGATPPVPSTGNGGGGGDEQPPVSPVPPVVPPLSAVPEPSTYALVLGGLLLLASTARRRRAALPAACVNRRD